MGSSDQLRFDGRVAVVTGAGGGLGREYALLLASRGASVVVNDLGGTSAGQGQSSKAADVVVDQIVQQGGKAVANYDSVENGEGIVKSAIDSFGRIDIVINNAGILRDKSFLKMDQQDWDLVHKVHLKGAFSVTKAAWPYFRDQKYGRILMTSSGAGLFGNFGQANYSSAKLGLLGLSNTLAVEGAKYNIFSNTLVPVAASRLTEDVLPPNILQQLQPNYVAPLVAWLVHEQNNENGGCFECAGGWMGKYRLQRAAGKAFIPPDQLTIEAVRDHWHQIVDFDQSTNPTSIHDQMGKLLESLSGKTSASSSSSPSPTSSSPASSSPSSSDIDLNRALNSVTTSHFDYAASDAILYALGVGVCTQEPNHLQYLYENAEGFQVLPTFGVIPGLRALFDLNLLNKAAELDPRVPPMNPTKLVHGEQYLEVYRPLTGTGAQMQSNGKLIEVLDKGSGSLLIAEVESLDSKTNEPLLYNQIALFVVGSGNFGGNRTSSNSNVRPVIPVPNRAPDYVVEQSTWPEQAALYRLSGDRNPLHIDPQFAAIGGFERPILHGLCTLGFAVRHILNTYASGRADRFKAVKVRFAGSILPGHTIRTLMWKSDSTPNRVHFECETIETGKRIVSSSYVDLTAIDEPTNSTSFIYSNEPKQQQHQQQPTIVGLSSSQSTSASTSLQSQAQRSAHTMAATSLAPASAPEKKEEELFFITDAIFEEINRRMMMAKDIRKRVGEMFQFNISKNGRPAAKTWILDMKSEVPSTYSGESKSGRPSCVIDIADEDMAALALGDLDPVKAFMSGRIRIKGNPMLTQKLDILFKLDSADAHPGVNDNFVPASSSATSPPLPAGAPTELKCKTDHIFAKWMLGRKNELKDYVPSIGHVYLWSIVKDGQVVSEWTCDFKNGSGDIYHGQPKNTKATCTLRMDDEDAVEIFAGKLDATKAFMSGKLKITGNVLAAQKLQRLWEDESPPPIEELLKSTESATTGNPNVNDSDDLNVDKIPCSGLKCDLIFNIFKNRCHEEPDFMQRLRVLFQFNITRKGKPMCVWTADNKTQPGIQVYRQPPSGIRPDVTVTVEDEDMLKIMVGKVNPQRLFMMGKVKVKGNIMLLQKLNTLWGEYQKLGKTPELPAVVEVMMKDPIKVGLKSEATVIDLMQRVVKLPDLPAKLPGLHQFDITQQGKVVSVWTLDFQTKRNTFYRGAAASAPTTQLQVDDTDFAKLVYMQLKLADSIKDGKVKVVKGDAEKILVLDKLFTTPTSLKPKL